MPAALDIDKEQVRMLVLQVGVREAARRMNLPEPTVAAWSARGQWLASVPRNQPLPPTVVQPAIGAISAPQALAQAMRDDAVRGRAAALRVSRRALERVDRMDDDELVVPEVAGMAHTWTKSAALAGGYGSADAVAKVALHITGNTAQVAAPDAIEAEWRDV